MLTTRRSASDAGAGADGGGRESRLQLGRKQMPMPDFESEKLHLTLSGRIGWGPPAEPSTATPCIGAHPARRPAQTRFRELCRCPDSGERRGRK